MFSHCAQPIPDLVYTHAILADRLMLEHSPLDALRSPLGTRNSPLTARHSHWRLTVYIYYLAAKLYYHLPRIDRTPPPSTMTPYPWYFFVCLCLYIAILHLSHCLVRFPTCPLFTLRTVTVILALFCFDSSQTLNYHPPGQR